MKRYSYRAKDVNGTEIRGEVEASTLDAAIKLLRGKSLIVIEIKPLSEGFLAFLGRFKDRITSADVSNFTRQFATMINAGLPITEALTILRVQNKGPMQRVVSQILANVEGGESLSKALSKHPKVFSPTYIALVKSGELGGVLDDVLARLADNLEKEQEFKGKVKGILIYPIIIVVGMVAVSLIMMIFVVPKLTSLYVEFGAELPLPTKILMSISNSMIFLWPFLLVGAVLGFYGLTVYRQTDAGKKMIDSLIFKIPLVGDLVKQITLTELTRTLSLMVGAGVSVLEGLTITSEVVGNGVISDALKDCADKVEKGFPIAYSFAKHPEAFPFILSQMIAVGEETGKMDDVLKKISHIFEVESDQKVKGLTAAVEPMVMIILGIGVAFLVIAVILPIYNLTSQF